MILSFKTEINGKPTFFIERIWNQIIWLKKVDTGDWQDFMKSYKDKFGKNWNSLGNTHKKRHTIREDKNNRWRAGMMIDFFINSRTKNMFRFAPRVPVVSVQDINIKYGKHDLMNILRVQIDSRIAIILIEDYNNLPSSGLIFDLAKNDGFDNIKDFLNYFNTDFTGKIIHWTDLRY